MKHAALVLCTIISLSMHTISAMDRQPLLQPVYKTQKQLEKTQKSSDDALYAEFTLFNQDIEKIYYKNPVNLIFRTSALNENEAFDFMSEFSKQFTMANNRTKLFDRALETNIFFCKVITYFITLAQKNFNAVTCDTLATIQNANAQQPIPQLNMLPVDIKAYVMNKAYDTLEYVYDVIFSGHTATIRSADINAREHVNLLATASEDGTFRLWNVSTGEQLHIFPEKACSGYVKFNDDGSLLATTTVTCLHTPKIQIKIWDIATKKPLPLHTIEQNESISALSFLQNQAKDTVLGVFKKTKLSIYRFEKNEEPTLLCYTESGPNVKASFTYLGNYIEASTYETGDKSFLKATKRAPDLYLCERARKNQKSAYAKIQQTDVYKTLPELEKKILNGEPLQNIQIHLVTELQRQTT